MNMLITLHIRVNNSLEIKLDVVVKKKYVHFAGNGTCTCLLVDIIRHIKKTFLE